MHSRGRGDAHQSEAGWLAGWLAWEYVEARQSGSIVVLADAGRREHVQFGGGKAGEARQGDDVARAAVDEDSARVELAVVCNARPGRMDGGGCVS